MYGPMEEHMLHVCELIPWIIIESYLVLLVHVGGSTSI